MNQLTLFAIVILVQIAGNLFFRLKVQRELRKVWDAIADLGLNNNTPVAEAPENEDITNSLSQRIGSLEIANRTLVRTIRREITKASKPRRN